MKTTTLLRSLLISLGLIGLTLSGAITLPASAAVTPQGVVPSQIQAPTITGTIRVEAWIDGRSQLILHGNTAQWHHLDWAAPGRELFVNKPTVINGVQWFPVWPDIPDAENRWCDCYSDIFSGVNPPLPQGDMTIQLRTIQSRGATTVVQLPTASNNFTLIIEFDDDPIGGSDTYIAEIDFTTGLFVSDNFSRTVSNGWGSAPVGGKYTIADDSFSNFAVNGSAGTMKAMYPNRFLRAMLMSVSALNLDATFRVKTDKSSAQGGQIAYFVSRRTGDGNDYLTRMRFAPNGSIRLQAERELSNVPHWIVAEVIVPGLTHTPNQYYRLRVQVTGANPTTIKMKAWQDGASEPSAWQLTATDSTAQLQAAGAVGLRSYLARNATNAPVVFTFDDFVVQAP